MSETIRRVMRDRMQIDGNLLIGYTDWERQKWHDWLGRHREALKTSMGPHAENQTVGELVRHIFSSEKRYVERLSGEPLTEPGTIPNDRLDVIFEFGRKSRQCLKDYVEGLPAPNWDILMDFEVVGRCLRATPRKIIIHVLTHEIRHWAQIATVFRMNGFKGDDSHDFVSSPMLGGDFISEKANASR